MSATVFIGMPVYNGERFLKEAVDSIRAQSHTNWKLYISDDASTDKTRSIASEYAKADSRIVYHRQERNLGLFANFKFTLDQASEGYFMWAAQDDVWDKDFIKVCLGHLESDRSLGLATTCNETIDSFGRKVLEAPWMTRLSGKPGYLRVARYVLEPEGLGKCNLMYAIFRTEALRATWKAYPQRRVWGQDYMFSLAAISRFGAKVDSRILFKKRLGGYSSPQHNLTDPNDQVRGLWTKNPKNQIFPFGRFRIYLAGHMEALRGTHYRFVAFLMLLVRLPRSFFIHVRERDVRKFLGRTMKKKVPPIIVKLNGGLCNQIFQYAFARALSRRLKRDFRLDITPFSTYYKADPYGLWKFNIQEKIAKDSDMHGFIWFRKHDKLFNLIYNKLRFKHLFNRWYRPEKTFAFDATVFSSEATYFEGFWQTEKYFQDIADELRSEITLKSPLSEHSRDIADRIAATNAVSLHIRRYPGGLPSWWHGSCPPDYFERAMRYVAERVSSPHFYVFSDNYPWVTENFLPVLESLGYPYTLVENNNDKNAEDVTLMSLCKHHILSNSSFSWWGAWLDPKKDKIVIAPTKWFANAPKNDTRDIVPDTWIKL